MEAHDEFVELASGIAIPASALPQATRPEGPSSADQVVVRPAASDLSLPEMTLPAMRALAERIPFEAAMVGLSRIAARIWKIFQDGQAQLIAAEEVFGRGPLIDLYREFLAQHPNGVLFSEQQLFIAQRLLVEHAEDVPLDVGLEEEQITDILTLLIHGNDIADAPAQHLDRPNPPELDVLAFLIQSGAYSHRPPILNAFSRAYTLTLEYAQANPDERLPLDQWAREDGFGLSIEEQLCVGFGLASSTNVFDDDPDKHSVLLAGPFLVNTALAGLEQSAIDLLSAERQWYVEAFTEGEDSQSLRNVAWETTPFLKKPFLRLADGRLVLVSPRSIVSWLGEGFYYRLLDSAQARRSRKNDLSALFTSYYGSLVEAYALDLMRSVLPENQNRVRVFGAQSYGKGGGKETPDIVLDCEGSVVTVEIRSGFLTRRLRIAGDPRELVRDLDRLLFRKINQLGARIADLVAGTAKVDDVDFAEAKEIWPVIVTANITLVEHLYAWVERDRPEALKKPPVRSVVILDLDDLEFLAGLIEQGTPILEIFREREQMHYRELEFTRYALEKLGADYRTRAKFTEEAWERAGELMKNTLKLSA
jgi:hypothetical protein